MKKPEVKRYNKVGFLKKFFIFSVQQAETCI